MLSHDKADKRKAPPPRLAGCGMSGWSHHEKVQALVLRRVAVVQFHRPCSELGCLFLQVFVLNCEGAVNGDASLELLILQLSLK